jgi:hypothetical protein
MPRVTNSDAASLAIIQVNVVYAGGGYSDEFQLGQSRQLRLAQGQLVADGDGSVLQSLNYLICRSLVIVNPFMHKVRPAKLDLESVAFEKDYAFHLMDEYR